MKLKFKVTIALVLSSICSIIFFNLNDVQALTQEEAGKYIAEFSINYYKDYGTQTTYSWNPQQRAAACRGEKTSGIAGAPTPYKFDNYYAVDCVGWVSMAIYQSLKIYYPGIVDTGATGYVVPTKYGNNYKPDIMEEVTGQPLKPGDILANSHHVMVYVGNIDGHDRIVHSVSRFHLNYDTFEDYGSWNSTRGSDTRGVYQKVYRIKESAAQKVNQADATTIFRGSGGITNNWSDSSGSSSSYTATQDGRIVDVNDKLPLFKHILLTEKYNFNNIKWKRYGHGYNGSDCDMAQDLNLGLKYPSDETNTKLDSFIDFSLPYLQTWMIPLSMNAGVSTKGTEDESSSNPMFTYSTIKKAMSDIIVNRYDITTCVLATKYREYNVVRVTETYNVTYANNQLTGINLTNTNEEVIESGVKEPEEEVSRKVDVEPEYHIKEALTFDTKISNEFKYIKYNDEDVNEKKEDGVGYVGRDERVGEAINEKGTASRSLSNNILTITYEKKVGNYKYVDRTWRDELQVENPKSEKYTYDDVKNYNKGSLHKNSISTDENGVDQTVNFNGKTIAYSAAFASQTKTPEELGLKYEKITNGETTNYDACRVCNESVNQVCSTGIDLKLGRKIVARWSKDSFVDYGDWVYIEGWGYALVADSGGFSGKANDKYHLDCFVGEEGDVIDDGNGNYSALKRKCINWKGVYERNPGSQTNCTIYRIKAEDIPEELLKGDATSSSDTNNSENKSEDLTDNSEFTEVDNQYYKALENDKEINKVDLMNSKPSEFLEYIQKGSQYSNHIGYSRSYLTFSYGALRKLLREYFEEKMEVPFAYGSSLGYSTYTGVNSIKAGSYNAYDGNSADLSGLEFLSGNLGNVGDGKPGIVKVPDGLGDVRTYTAYDRPSAKGTWTEGMGPANLIKHLGATTNSRGGELGGKITKNSKDFIGLGKWYAIAMVKEFGGKRGSPAMTLNHGDMLFLVQNDGTWFPAMLFDVKQQTWNHDSRDNNPANEWGHNNGHCVVEFEMWGLSSKHSDPANMDSRFKRSISYVIRVGNVYKNPTWLDDPVMAVIDLNNAQFSSYLPLDKMIAYE